MSRKRKINYEAVLEDSKTMLTKDIARKHCCTVQYIGQVLEVMGGKAIKGKRGRPKAFDDALIAELKAEHANGKSMYQIAKERVLDYGSVRYHILGGN